MEACANLGYLVVLPNANTYKLYIPDRNEVIISRDVKFEEVELRCQ